jgi:hypothetical protein
MATARYKVRINNSFPYEKKGTRSLDEIETFLGDMRYPDTDEMILNPVTGEKEYNDDLPF